MMKKRMITMMLALVAMLPLQAQSLEGRWMAEEEGEEEAVAYLLEFNGDKVVQGMIAGSPMEGVGDVVVSIVVPAQAFVPGANAIDFKFDPSQAVVDLEAIEYIDAIKQVIEKEPSKADETKKIVLSAFEQQKEEMAKEMLLSGHYTITKQTADELELKDPNGDMYRYKRIKK
jgi:hypothetical protein